MSEQPLQPPVGEPQVSPSSDPTSGTPEPVSTSSPSEGGSGQAEPTVISSPTGVQTPATPETPPSWVESAPEDWREMLAGEDQTKLNLLKRVSSFNQLVDNYANAQEKIRAGSIEAAAVPTEDSTPEEWAEYREGNGIPETADDYKLSLDDGLVLGPDDEEVLSNVYPVAHQMNLSTEQVSQLTNAMVKAQSAQFHQQVIQQNEYQKEADNIVKQTWGGDYETNKQALTNVVLGSLPEDVRDEFAHATLADGRKVFNSPEMLIAMADWARKIDPQASVIPNSPNATKAVTDRISELEGQMGTKEWYRDTDAQAELQRLYNARDSIAKQ